MSLPKQPLAALPRNSGEQLPGQSDAESSTSEPLSSPSASPRSDLNLTRAVTVAPQIRRTPTPSGSLLGINHSANGNDTIAYLEAIKKQLSNQPDVYGRFLDILKDFKGEIIDTHGAVQAVVRLFYGNHELIQGFAVFLPAGYAIDVSQNPPTLIAPHSLARSAITSTIPPDTTHDSSYRVQMAPASPAASDAASDSGKTKTKSSSKTKKEESEVADSEQSDEEGGEEEEEYEIEAILDAKKGHFPKNKLGFLVKWKGYSDAHNSWVVEADAANADELIKAFWAEREKKKSPGASAVLEDSSGIVDRLEPSLPLLDLAPGIVAAPVKKKDWQNSPGLPVNLITHTLSVLRRRSDSRLDQLRNSVESWKEWDTLTGLSKYHSIVKMLLSLLKEDSTSDLDRHIIAIDIFEKLAKDDSAISAKLILMLHDSKTYKQLLACKGSHAQDILDVVQDILDFSSEARPLLSKALIRLARASGLHPRCFALSGLEKIGQQVAAGGFGDV